MVSQKAGRMRRFVQVVLYVQMAFLSLAGIVGFLAHKFPIAAQEQPLARQVGFLLLGYVAVLWVVARLWGQETRLLLIPIILETAGLWCQRTLSSPDRRTAKLPVHGHQKSR